LRWRADPVQYVTDVFGATPEKWQAEALTALATKDKVSVRSGHGVGKSTLDSWTIFWFMTCYFPCKIPCTAPTLHQLKDILWAELAKWHKRMPDELRSQFRIKSSDQDMRVVNVHAPESSFAVGRAGRKDNPEALQGFHEDNLLFIIDEASGIDEIVFEVAQGALSTEHSKVLMTANPTRTSGYFFDSHHKMRHRWHTMKVSCKDSTRVSPTYIKDVEEKYGLDSNVYRVRVLGEFPQSEDDVVIPLELCEAAVTRDVQLIDTYMPVWGLDVARFGDDDSALCKRHANHIIEPPKVWHQRDTMEVSGLILKEYEETDAALLPGSIMVDVIGIGAGVVDRLKELGLPVRAVNVGESATGNNYARLRDELWWRGRDWFDDKQCRIPDDGRLIGELSTVKYKVTSSGKIQVESKDDMKKRGLKSPDVADSFILTFAGLDRRGNAHKAERYVPRRRKRNWYTR